MLKSIIFIFLLPIALHAKPLVHIGIVYDGWAEHEVGYFDVVHREITDLLDEEYEVRFIPFADEWSLGGSYRTLQQALWDSRVDVVVTLGLMSTYLVTQVKEIQRPVVMGYNLNYFVQPGSSVRVKHNPLVAYYESRLGLVGEIEVFLDITKAKKIAYIGDKSLIGLSDFPILREKIVASTEKAGAIPIFIPVKGDSREALKALDEELVDAVVLLPTWRLTSEGVEKLVEGVNARYLPSYSVYGEAEVKEGVLMTLTPQSEFVRAGRRIALNVQELLTNGNTSELVFSFSRAEELIINEKTAKEIGIDFSWNVLRQAHFIDQVPPDPLEMMGILKTTTLAVENNLDLLAENYVVKSGQQEVGRAFSDLMPQVNSRVKGRVIDTNTARANFGFEPERLIRGSILVDQMLYDERRVSNYTIQRRTQEARVYNRDAIELDIILDASVSYLLVLRASADIKIAEQNIALSRANLKRAYELVESGQARLSEVYRWESEVASNVDALVSLEATLENLQTEFNRLLNRPLNSKVVLDNISPFDPSFTFDFGQLTQYVNSPKTFEKYKEFMICYSRDKSPDVKRLDMEILAQARKHTAKKRALYLPDFNAFGEFSNNMYRGGAGNTTAPGVSSGKMETAIGIELTYPLFTGGRRQSEKNQTFFDLQKLRTERAALVERIDEAVIQAIDNMKASYEGIFLARDAAEAADKNLVIVTNSYERGVISIVDLLDAQNQAIVSRQNHSNALYDYLIDFMDFQRAVSQFSFTLSEEEKMELKERLIAFLEEK